MRKLQSLIYIACTFVFLMPFSFVFACLIEGCPNPQASSERTAFNLLTQEDRSSCIRQIESKIENLKSILQDSSIDNYQIRAAIVQFDLPACQQLLQNYQ